jgi:hypothetical protein
MFYAVFFTLLLYGSLLNIKITQHIYFGTLNFYFQYYSAISISAVRSWPQNTTEITGYTVVQYHLFSNLDRQDLGMNILSTVWNNCLCNTSVKYLISRNYYIQINKTWYYINVYTAIKGYLAVAWWFLPVNYNYSRSRNMIAPTI